MRPAFVLDNSVIMTWCFEDESVNYSEAVLESLLKNSAIVPSIWPLEVTNVLLVGEKRKRLRRVDSIHFIALLRELPIIVEPENTERIMNELLTVGSENNLSSYDASYLYLAMRYDIPLATLDGKLQDPAIKTGVGIYLQNAL